MYLAWSLPYLLLATALVSVVVYMFDRFMKRGGNKYNKVLLLVPYIAIILNAFNIGDRQSELSRNKFDNEMNKIIDKVEVDKVTSSVVSKQFKEGLNND